MILAKAKAKAGTKARASAKAGPGRPRVAVKRAPILTLKGVPEYKAWLDRLAAHCDLSAADTIGQALARYAELRGFEAPPRR